MNPFLLVIFFGFVRLLGCYVELVGFILILAQPEKENLKEFTLVVL